MNEILSFRIDHTKLKPGIYLHEIKDFGSNKVTTYDLRFKIPNSGNYLTPVEIHTIEHVAATFFTNKLPDKIYFGPMGCMTGFYLVLNGEHTLEDITSTLDELNEYFVSLVKKHCVPGKNPFKCGNYRLLDIESGYNAWKEFYDSRASWSDTYPLLDKDVSDESYQNDINFGVRIK